ncbi:polysaccharide deacetylase family protein [Actinopolymorpha sp. B17G11]|uniref:polysaccharide deacetylase family protein n=1 Tax=Actinopolymorpha sp. B17G11 TaxID=3160861 RepID=UPI0032E45533
MTLHYFMHGSRDSSRVAVTFDDGPNPPRTEQVLDILAAEGCQATFFLIGKWVERWPDTVRRIMDRGHVIGNHSHTHVVGVGDYDDAEAAISHVTGGVSRFARAPAFDYASCAQSPLVISGELVLIDADVKPSDWAKTDADAIAEAILSDPDLQGGSIIVLHDSSEQDDAAHRLGRPVPMIEALPTVLRTLRQRGYELVGLDQLELVDPVPWSPEVPQPELHRAAQTASNP